MNHEQVYKVLTQRYKEYRTEQYPGCDVRIIPTLERLYSKGYIPIFSCSGHTIAERFERGDALDSVDTRMVMFVDYKEIPIGLIKRFTEWSANNYKPEGDYYHFELNIARRPIPLLEFPEHSYTSITIEVRFRNTKLDKLPDDLIKAWDSLFDYLLKDEVL